MLKCLPLVLTLCAGAAYAQDHSHHGAAGESASTKAYIAANTVMHEGMMIEFTGDADIDFLRGMIAHHQGAVDMSRVVVEHGKDPEIRALAQEIIAAQEKEIAWMQERLSRYAK